MNCCCLERKRVKRLKSCGCPERKHVKKLRRAGYIVDKPADYTPEKYSTYQRHPPFGVTVYTKYGRSYSLEEVNYWLRVKQRYPDTTLKELYVIM